MAVRYAVGLQNRNDAFLQKIIENREYIYEVYLSWGDFPNGRSSQLRSAEYTEWEMQRWQTEALERLAKARIPLNLLFNANCYGRDSQSRALFSKIGNTADYIKSSFGLSSVTTTSPLIAKFFKYNFAGIEVRASVNMEIGTVQGMAYVAQYFDSYYMKRELSLLHTSRRKRFADEKILFSVRETGGMAV